MYVSFTHTHTRYIYTICTFEYSFSLFTSSVCQELEKDELLFLIIIAFTFLFFLLHWIIYIYIFLNNTRSAKPIIYVSHMENLALKENKSKEASLRCPSESKGIKQIVFTTQFLVLFLMVIIIIIGVFIPCISASHARRVLQQATQLGLCCQCVTSFER